MRHRAARAAASPGSEIPARSNGITRRHAVGAFAALLGATPMWELCAIPKVAPDPDAGGQAAEDEAEIGRAYVRAKRAGRPLLVLVLPVDGTKRRDREALFHQLLHEASADVLADLALCEVVSRTIDQLDPVVTGIGGSEPLMILIETDSSVTRYAILDGPIPDEGESISRRVSALGQLVRSGVSPSAGVLIRREEQARARLDPAARARIDGALASRKVPRADDVQRGAALVRVASGSASPEWSVVLTNALATSAQRHRSAIAAPTLVG